VGLVGAAPRTPGLAAGVGGWIRTPVGLVAAPRTPDPGRRRSWLGAGGRGWCWSAVGAGGSVCRAASAGWCGRSTRSAVVGGWVWRHGVGGGAAYRWVLLLWAGGRGAL